VRAIRRDRVDSRLCRARALCIERALSMPILSKTSPVATFAPKVLADTTMSRSLSPHASVNHRLGRCLVEPSERLNG
jgi:hypothetical protein